MDHSCLRIDTIATRVASIPCNFDNIYCKLDTGSFILILYSLLRHSDLIYMNWGDALIASHSSLILSANRSSL
jgi:hypothetical protein